MKSNTAVFNAIRKEAAIKAIPELVINWNMNRYIGGVVSNTPSDSLEGFDAELFPIESLIQPNRPTKGINKARVQHATVSDEYLFDGNGVSNGRFYVCDVDDTYKYWTSPRASDANGLLPVYNVTNFPAPPGESYSYDNGASVRPTVIYNESVGVNKIVIKTENTWATAKTFQVQVTTAAEPTSGQWTTVASNSTLGNAWKASGQITLWYNGDGTVLNSWVSTGRVDNADKSPKKIVIRGVRLVVTELEGGYKITPDNTLVKKTYVTFDGARATTKETDGKEAFFDLIEISANLEVDLSPHVINVSDNFTLSDASALFPIGTITSNEADVTLSNLYKNEINEWVPGLFSHENTESPYHKYIEPNAEVNLRYLYYTDENQFLGAIQQFKMYTVSWTGQSTEEIQISLMDFSKFFNTSDLKLRSSLWENLSISEIVWRILDSVGFVDYEVKRDVALSTQHTIPIFYTDGEKNVWETLDELAQAAQAAIYFDSNGKLQIKTREFAFSKSDTAKWDFNATSNFSHLADIEELDIETKFEPNHYKVTYQNTNWSPETNGMPALQTVWEPDDTTTLRASALARTLELDHDYMWINPDDIALWPYQGVVNIEGELIKYNGKELLVFSGADASIKNYVMVKSNDEYKEYMAKTPAEHRHKNVFSGAVDIVERGVWNSEARRHPVDVEGYRYNQILNGIHYGESAVGFNHNKAMSRAELASPTRYYDRRDIMTATRGVPTDQEYYYYGTRFRFLAQGGRNEQCAGIVIHQPGGANEDGYYFEFTPSNRAVPGKVEVVMYRRKNNQDSGMYINSAIAIVENLDYEVDISYRIDGNGKHNISLWLNGKLVANVRVSAQDQIAPSGRWGVFIRGRTLAEFEYLYAIRRPEESPLLEDFSFLEKVRRGYMGGQWDREWAYHWGYGSRVVKKETVKFQRRMNRQFFDEFGPIVHEVREFDVKFEPKPVLHSRLYLTNDWATTCLEYSANPFGAKFILANTWRKNAVVHGEDSLSFSGTGESVNQALQVMGRALVVDEAATVIAENTDQIRKRGKVESEITSPWIQSKAMADDVANWMRDNFSYGNETIKLKTFGNPLVEVGDVVHVNYPARHIDGDYFVLAAESTFEQGLETSFTLRRRITSS